VLVLLLFATLGFCRLLVVRFRMNQRPAMLAVLTRFAYTGLELGLLVALAAAGAGLVVRQSMLIRSAAG
jgi:hypothetical protein